MSEDISMVVGVLPRGLARAVALVEAELRVPELREQFAKKSPASLFPDSSVQGVPRGVAFSTIGDAVAYLREQGKSDQRIRRELEFAYGANIGSSVADYFLSTPPLNAEEAWSEDIATYVRHGLTLAGSN